MTLYAVEYVYTADKATIDEVRPAHREYLAGLAESGSLRGSGPFTDGAPGALLVFSASDDDALAQLLAADPFAQAGVIAETRTRAWNVIIGPWAQAV